MPKPKYPFFLHSKLGFWVVLDLFLDMRNALIYFLTIDKLTLE